jgi:hypothetical protein
VFFTEDEMTIREMIAVLEAAERGEKIQYLHNGKWVDALQPVWAFNTNNYRVKPKPREWWVSDYPNRTPMVMPTYASEHPGENWVKVREVIE